MKKQYTLDQVKKSIIRLRNELGHEPSALEIDDCSYTPPSRTIQRRFGGLTALRKELNFEHVNHTTGPKRSNVARAFLKKAKVDEANLHNALIKKHHDLNKGVRVIRQFAWQQYIPKTDDYSNTLADSAISNDETNHVDIFDFFYAADNRSLGGVYRIKKQKYIKNPVHLLDGATHQVYFVCTNPELSQAQINQTNLSNENFCLLSLDEFKKRYLD